MALSKKGKKFKAALLKLMKEHKIEIPMFLVDEFLEGE